MLVSHTSPAVEVKPPTQTFLGVRHAWELNSFLYVNVFFDRNKFELLLATWVGTLYSFFKSTLSSLFMVTTAGHSYLQGLQSPETFEGIGFYALDLISFQVTKEKYHICTVKP